MSYSPILLKDIQEGFTITEDDYSICLYGREQFEYYLKNILIQSDCDLFFAPSSVSGVAPCLSQESTGNLKSSVFFNIESKITQNQFFFVLFFRKWSFFYSMDICRLVMSCFLSFFQFTSVFWSSLQNKKQKSYKKNIMFPLKQKEMFILFCFDFFFCCVSL